MNYLILYEELNTLFEFKIIKILVILPENLKATGFSFNFN